MVIMFSQVYYSHKSPESIQSFYLECVKTLIHQYITMLSGKQINRIHIISVLLMMIITVTFSKIHGRIMMYRTSSHYQYLWVD